MLGASELTVEGEQFKPDHPMPSAETPLGTLYMELGADADKEVARLRKELEKLNTVITGIKNKLRNQQFLAKAPQDVVDKERDKLEQFSEKAERLRRQLVVLEPET
jgi:valyl-tRNA synthetase